MKFTKEDLGKFFYIIDIDFDKKNLIEKYSIVN